MTGPGDRRGFLRGLVSLPLIGGGVTLVGSPTGAAEPITPGMLATYSAWLHFERMALMRASARAGASMFVPLINPGCEFHSPRDFDLLRAGYEAQHRAPVVLATVGCPKTSAEAEDQWSETFRQCWRERS